MCANKERKYECAGKGRIGGVCLEERKAEVGVFLIVFAIAAPG